MRIVIASIIIALSVSGCGSSDEEPVGNPATFARINALTSCATLQAEFDQFFIVHDDSDFGSTRREAALAYINATDARMEEVGCYG